MTPLHAAALALIPTVPLHAQDRTSTLEDWIRDPFHPQDSRIRLTGLRHETHDRGHRCPTIDGSCEASEDWTALRVKIPDGPDAGRVFDAGVHAMD